MQILWILAIALVRISIASSLLRLSNHKAWRSALWIIITIQILIYFGLMVFQLFNCSSIRANWEPVYNLRCWDRKYILVFGKTANCMFLNTTDYVIANRRSYCRSVRLHFGAYAYSPDYVSAQTHSREGVDLLSNGNGHSCWSHLCVYHNPVQENLLWRLAFHDGYLVPMEGDGSVDWPYGGLFTTSQGFCGARPSSTGAGIRECRYGET